MRVLHVVGSLDREWGGLATYVSELAAGLAELGHAVQVISRSHPQSDSQPVGKAVCIPLPAALKTWDSLFDAADVVHVHGLWLPLYHRALVTGRRFQKPCVLSTHGMLEPAAMKFSRWKKRLAWWGYQRNDLKSASLVHATALSERENLRAVGLTQPLAVLPPGVSLPADLSAVEQPVRQALFLGRIHPVKGIVNLIEAWALVRPRGWKLVLAGPDEKGHLAEVMRALAIHGLEQHVEYRGPAFGGEKARLMRSASLFVAPSLTENFGIAIAEALAHGLPVVTTRGTPWASLPEERCGWWVPVGVEPLATALREATSLEAGELRIMGRRGRALVEREFAWPRLALEMSGIYRWLLGQAPKPDSVQTG